MKRYTSKLLKSVAVFYLTFPIHYVIISAVLFDIPLTLCIRILLSPSYYFIGALAIVVGYGLWEMRRWAWYLLVTVDMLISYESALFVNDYGESHHKGLAFSTFIFILFLITYRVSKEIRVPYFFPRIRWWESNPRYRLSVSVKLERKKNGEVVHLDGQILDLSMGGCFVKLRTEIPQDEVLSLSFTVFGHPISCEGMVVWRTQSTVTHPKGLGIKFGSLSRAQKKSLKQINQRLKKIAAFYRRSRYLLNQDEFMKRLEEIENRGNEDSRVHTG